MMSARGQPRLTAEQVRWLSDLAASQHTRLVRMAGRALPASDRTHAEDVVQTVFTEAVAASAGRPWIRIGAGWLVKRLRARIIDHHRRASRQQRLAAMPMADVVASVEDLAADRAAVDELLAAVPDSEDRLALAFKLYGYREAEIADMLSLPPEGRRVRDRMQRVRRLVGARRSEALGLDPAQPGRT